MAQSEFDGALAPTDRRVLSDDVTAQLRDAIVTGVLVGGTRLREDDLAASMNVSRGPIREALVRLERESLVIIERYKGARVAELYRDDLDQIFSLRKALESLAAEWACKRATPEDIKKLSAPLDAFLAAPIEDHTPEFVSKLDIEFHDALIASAHHARLERAWDGLRAQVYSFLSTRMALRLDYAEVWEPDHRRHVKLIEKGDVAGAVAHTIQHLESSYARVVLAMERGE
jgi:DNA-binding GntR family transcriptional regulator